MPHDVFISYSTRDKGIAEAICAGLESSGIGCWIAPRNIPAGHDYAEAIIDAMNACKIMVLIFSSNANQSKSVRKEVERAAHKAMTIIPLCVENVIPAKSFEFFISSVQWFDATTAPLGARLPSLAELIRSLLRPETSSITSGPADSGLETVPAKGGQPQPDKPIKALQQDASLRLDYATMAPDSKFYVERAADSIALREIEHQGVTLMIKGPLQSGKSSLVMRLIKAAESLGKRVAFLDFQHFGREALTNRDLFFRNFCSSLTEILEMKDKVDEFWDARVSEGQNCTRYLSRYILKEPDAPLVLAMDEINGILESDLSNDFFGMLRAWHNSRASSPAWKQLDLVLVTSTEPYQLLTNRNQSPFHIGEVIELSDFTSAGVAELNRRYGSPLTPADEARLMDLVSGHPFLVRRALHLVASQSISADRLFAEAISDGGPFAEHLRYFLFELSGDEYLERAMRKVLMYSSCNDDRAFFRLLGTGLIRRSGRDVIPRCRLYKEYLRQHLTI